MACASDKQETILRGLRIFVGAAFSLLCLALTMLNSEKVQNIRAGSLDRRWKSCVFVAAKVAMFSAVFNFFQLSDLDEIPLQHADGYTMKLSRPIEWICTCPFIQLILTLLAGKKVPDSRAYLMPGLALAVLITGVISTLIENIYGRATVYAVSCIIVSVQFYYLQRQISEFSDGKENLFRGTSFFRYLTLDVIYTWFPFPIWYFLTPEGFNIIDNPVIIEVGWSVLNVLAKFSFLIMVQQGKDAYFKESLKQGAEFKVDPSTVTKTARSALIAKAGKGVETADDDVDVRLVIQETCTFLGIENLAQKVEKLLAGCNCLGPSELLKLDEHKCLEQQLPWGVVYAVQRRVVAKAAEASPASVAKKAVEDRNAAEEQKLSKIKRLFEAVAGQARENLQQEITAGKASGLEDNLLKFAETRLQDLDRWENVQVILRGHLSTAIAGKDVDAVKEAIRVAELAGLADVSKLATAKLLELEKAKTQQQLQIKKGNAKFKAQDYAAALTAFSSALNFDPKDEVVLARKAEVLLKLERWAEAEECTLACLSLKPQDNADLRCMLITALNGQERGDEAKTECLKALSQYPDHKVLLALKETSEWLAPTAGANIVLETGRENSGMPLCLEEGPAGVVV